MTKHMVVLPVSGPKPTYYSAYVGYIKGILNACHVDYVLDGVCESTKFLMKVNGKPAVVDFSDHYDVYEPWLQYPYFKFHCDAGLNKKNKNVHPFAPISFHNWEQQATLKKEICYAGTSDAILNIQTPGGNAVARRKKVQKLLIKAYPKTLDLKHVNQIDYWRKINNCLVHVFVPGARNNMIDRGHMQYFSFGCCTICPNIGDILPYDREIIPGTHYVECASDYSDLVDKIEWCRDNRDACREVGRQAKKLFGNSCTPEKLWSWLRKNV